ncbi:MAG: hypothetical protein QXU32_04955 [Nitrososphaerales archaeon]
MYSREKQFADEAAEDYIKMNLLELLKEENLLQRYMYQHGKVINELRSALAREIERKLR